MFRWMWKGTPSLFHFRTLHSRKLKSQNDENQLDPSKAVRFVYNIHVMCTFGIHTACRLSGSLSKCFHSNVSFSIFQIDIIEISNDNISFQFSCSFSVSAFLWWCIYNNLRDDMKNGPKIEKHFSICSFGFSELIKLYSKYFRTNIMCMSLLPLNSFSNCKLVFI